jgi:hypothetical protein
MNTSFRKACHPSDRRHIDTQLPSAQLFETTADKQYQMGSQLAPIGARSVQISSSVSMP